MTKPITKDAPSLIGVNRRLAFSAAELGIMKQVVSQMQDSRNKGEQTKAAKNIVAFLSQMHGIRYGTRLVNIELVSVQIEYVLEEDDSIYTFFYKQVPAKEKKEKPEKVEDQDL